MEESVKNLEQEQPCGEMENAMEQEQQAPIDFLVHCKQALRLERIDIANYSPLALAYIGDAVYELMIRTHVVSHGSMQVNKMHKKSASLVKAQTQAELIKILEPELTPLEHAAYKRGRNAKSVTMAKHATMKEYRTATGFEALIGYLYLQGRLERLAKLLGLGLDRLGKWKDGEGAKPLKNAEDSRAQEPENTEQAGE